MATFLSYLVLACVCAWLQPSAVADLLRFSLDGSDWRVSNANGSLTVSAHVPGVVHLDLLAAGVIDDPYYRYNEREQAWVWQEPYWNFTRTLDISHSFLAHSAVELVFDGLDTAASIYVNGRLVGHSANQFRRVTLSVGDVLMEGSNELMVAIQSPVLYAQSAYNRYPYDVPGPMPQKRDPTEALPYRNFLRKVQSDSAWDWGPGFAPSGIWKHCELRAFNEAVMVDATFQAVPVSTSTTWAVNVTAYMRVTGGPQKGRLIASVAGTEHSGSFTVSPSNPAEGDELSVVSLMFKVEQPQLWWPVGYGEPALYSFNLTWQGATETVSLQRRVGFRTIRLVREPTPVDAGLSMFFEVNGVAVWAKGSNLIPFDSFHPRVTAANITRVLHSALLSHQNVIRIWGGGLYQSDLVYDYADEHGLMLWTEFAFACAMYPVDRPFLDNVREEVSQVVRRLTSHPSLAIFGGNNENEAALNWYEETRTYRDRYLVDYNTLYVDVIRDAVLRETGQYTEFQVSSPTNGPLALEPFTQRWGDPSSFEYGDTHWYVYDADCANVTQFPRARFVSEFGFQSFPSFLTWRTISDSSDWSFNSDLSLFRQHHDDGQEQMEYQVRRYFNWPNATDSTQQFDDTIYTTQLAQAFCYGMEIQHWRRIRNESPGRTMGAIYWQLQDVWQGQSWASIEWGGRWKPVLYTIQQAFQPNLISAYVEPLGDPYATVFVYAVSEVQREQRGKLQVSVRHWATGAEVASETAALTVPALQSRMVFNITLNTLLTAAPASCSSPADCFVRLYWRDETNALVSSHDLLLDRLMFAPLVDPHVQLTVLQTDGQAEVLSAVGHRHPRAAATLASSVSVNVSCSAPAAWLFVETETAGYWDTNTFHLLPDQPKILTFTGYEEFDASEMQSSLTSRSLWDITHRG